MSWLKVVAWVMVILTVFVALFEGLADYWVEILGFAYVFAYAYGKMTNRLAFRVITVIFIFIYLANFSLIDFALWVAALVASIYEDK